MIFFYLEKRGRQRSGRALWISQGGGEREPLPHSPKQTQGHIRTYTAFSQLHALNV